MKMPSLNVSWQAKVALILVFTALAFFGRIVGMGPQAQGQSRQAGRPSQPGAAVHPGHGSGEKIFATTCAGCHGLDGGGGDKAPNIAGNPRVQHLSDAQLSRIISNGILGTGMPAFRTLSEEKVSGIVSYLRVLQGKQVARVLPGDPAGGKEIFFGKGECSTCHTISGAGGFLGPDLSAYGAGESAKSIEDALLSRDRIVPAGYRLAVATTRDGTRLEGVVRNEDNFSVQLQAKDGSFHFLEKSDLQSLEYPNQPLMPTDYDARLSRAELNDLVSYLMTAGSPPVKAHASKRAEDDD